MGRLLILPVDREQMEFTDKPLILFDLNGVLVTKTNTSFDENGARVCTTRLGLSLLLLLLSKYRLGVFSSATKKNVTPAVRKVCSDVFSGRKSLWKEHPANLLRLGQKVAVVLATDRQPSTRTMDARSKKAHVKRSLWRLARGKKNEPDIWRAPGVSRFIPQTVRSLFAGGVFTRDQCEEARGGVKQREDASSNTAEEQEGQEEGQYEEQVQARNWWDTVKPLHRLGVSMDRVLLVDDDLKKIVRGEESNAIEIPAWDECQDGGLGCLRALVDSLLRIPVGTDLRTQSSHISSRLREAATVPLEICTKQ